jgi:hypothetical protein
MAWKGTSKHIVKFKIAKSDGDKNEFDEIDQFHFRT